MLNRIIFSRPGEKLREQREQGEQPHEYRCIPVPSTKNDRGTQGTDYETVPPVPLAENDGEQEIAASVLTVPRVPCVPSQKRSSQNPKENPQEGNDVMFICTKIRNGSAYLGSHLSPNDYFCENEPVADHWTVKGAGQLDLGAVSASYGDVDADSLWVTDIVLLPCESAQIPPSNMGAPMCRVICTHPKMAMEILELQWGPTHFNPRRNTSAPMSEISLTGNITATIRQRTGNMFPIRFPYVDSSLPDCFLSVAVLLPYGFPIVDPSFPCRCRTVSIKTIHGDCSHAA